MQIVRTDVSRATALTGEPVLRVLFCGEGGDCVTVDMASVESGSDDAALDRARAILVQTASFGLAANDYDARSNGNFDEVAVTRATDRNDGVYIFEYRDGEGSRQVPPSRMPSFDAAREEASVLGDVQVLALTDRVWQAGEAFARAATLVEESAVEIGRRALGRDD